MLKMSHAIEQYQTDNLFSTTFFIRSMKRHDTIVTNFIASLVLVLPINFLASVTQLEYITAITT